MKTVRMKRNQLVEGIRRRAGDLVAVRPDIAQRLVSEGAADWTVPPDPQEAGRRDARPVSPNRMKFASLVGKLDPHQEDYAEQVAALNAQYLVRDQMIKELHNRLRAAQVPLHNGFFAFGGPVAKAEESTKELLAVLEAAIDRFVVDRF